MPTKPVTTQIADSKLPALGDIQRGIQALAHRPAGELRENLEFAAKPGMAGLLGMLLGEADRQLSTPDPESCEGIGCAGDKLPDRCEPCRRTQREMLTGPGERR